MEGEKGLRITVKDHVFHRKHNLSRLSSDETEQIDMLISALMAVSKPASKGRRAQGTEREVVVPIQGIKGKIWPTTIRWFVKLNGDLEITTAFIPE